MRALELPILARETPWRLEGLTKRATIVRTTIEDLIWKAKDQKKRKENARLALIISAALLIATRIGEGHRT